MLAAIAALWLLREDGPSRLAEWEKIVLAGLFLLTLNPRSVSDMIQLPIGPLVTLGLAALVVVQAVRALAIATNGKSGQPVSLSTASLRFARSGQ